MPASVGGGSIAPPAGSPGLFYTFKDNLFHGGTKEFQKVDRRLLRLEAGRL